MERHSPSPPTNMINLSWLIFPKVSRVVPAREGVKTLGGEEGQGGREGTQGGERRREAGGGMRRRGGGGRKGARGKKERKLCVFGSHQPGQKNSSTV